MTHIKESILQAAMSLNRNELTLYKLDTEFVEINAKFGIHSVELREAELVEYLVTYVPAGPFLLELIDALNEASTEVDLVRPMPSGVPKLSEPVYADRNILMAQLIAWEITGLVPKAAVDRIKAGKGIIDAARDVLAIVKLTSKYPVTKPKLMSTPQELGEMVKRANALLSLANKVGARSHAAEAYHQALELESRIWKLVTNQHEVLWKHGAQLFGHAVDEHVPALGSRVLMKKPVPAVPQPTL